MMMENKTLERSIANDDREDAKSLARMVAWDREEERLGRPLTTKERNAISRSLDQKGN